IIEMVNYTRLDCAIGMASVMRQAVSQAMHYCAHRAAFGNTLIDQPLMQNVLADLALESEAATTLMMRMAQAYDEVREDPEARHFARMVTAVGKYWTCKRAPHFVFECMECLGGGGYVEECNMPRLYREAPVCAIWEGSGNVISLDMLRALHKDPQTLPAFLAELDHARGGDKRLDAFLDKLPGEFAGLDGIETRARRIMEKLALALQATLLMRFAPDYVADAFIASRIAGDHGHEYGTLPKNTAFRDIIDRVRPKTD
ncbi:MAG TPA: acyl-CoA dehydrogenase family protein, partial [Candidatus Hydrogenedentes bacterium]|nr:acyl-CoA dehydrogenase family protein [Candidatus Hydrogenedentota bacterium]